MLTVTPWDKGLVSAIEKALRESDLGLNPQTQSGVIRVPLPALNEQRRSFNGATVLVLGVAYKRNVSDVRESPALDIIQALLSRKAVVIYNDEYVPSLAIRDQILHSQPLSSGLLQAADCVVIVTDHSYYDVPWIVREARYVVDTHNVTNGCKNKKILRI